MLTCIIISWWLLIAKIEENRYSSLNWRIILEHMRGQCFEKHVTSVNYESGFYLGVCDPFLDKVLRKMTLEQQQQAEEIRMNYLKLLLWYLLLVNSIQIFITENSIMSLVEYGMYIDGYWKFRTFRALQWYGSTGNFFILGTRKWHCRGPFPTTPCLIYFSLKS